MVANLHSLLSGYWHIEDAYAMSLYPALQNIIAHGEFKGEKHNPNTLQSYNQAGIVAAKQADTSLSNTVDQSVAVLNIKTPIYKYDQTSGPTGTRTMMQQLEIVANNPNIAGVVLDIDSGGGQVSGTAELEDYLATYPKPTVTFTDGVMASAALRVGIAANHVIAHKRAMAIGSIGSMYKTVDLKGMIEQAGGKVIEVYATKSTRKNEPTRELLENDNPTVLLNEILDPLNEDFHASVRSHRPDVKEEALQGAVYFPEQALQMGLIDQIGTLQDAVNKVFELSKGTTNNSSNINQKTTTMSQTTTDRPLLQAAMGLDVALASVDGHSSLSNEHLDAVEQHLATQAQAVTDAQAATQAATDAQATAEIATTTVAATLDTILASNGLEVAETATAQDKQIAIQAHISDLGQREAAHPSTVKVDAQEQVNNQVDMSLKHYADGPTTIRKS